ncbi:MAG: hypothetical protein AAFX08_09540 [Pseudomonadota bacterium]
MTAKKSPLSSSSAVDRSSTEVRISDKRQHSPDFHELSNMVSEYAAEAFSFALASDCCSEEHVERLMGQSKKEIIEKLQQKLK